MRSSVIAGVLIASLGSFATVHAAEASNGVDPKASQLLRQSLDYLAAQKSFSLRADSSLLKVMMQPTGVVYVAQSCLSSF